MVIYLSFALNVEVQLKIPNLSNTEVLISEHKFVICGSLSSIIEKLVLFKPACTLRN